MRIQIVAPCLSAPDERRQRPCRGPCHFVLCETRPLGEAPSLGGARIDIIVTSKNLFGLKKNSATRTIELSLPSVGSEEATLLDRCGPTAGATVDRGSFQRELRLEAVRPRAAPPSLSLKVVKFRPQNKQMADAPDCSPDGPVNLADDEQQPTEEVGVVGGESPCVPRARAV